MKEIKAADVNTGQYGRSNVALSHGLQHMFIQFIVENVQEPK